MSSGSAATWDSRIKNAQKAHDTAERFVHRFKLSGLKHSFLFHELDESQFPQEYPSAAAKLLLKVLRNTPIPDYDLDRVDNVVRRVAPLGAPLDLLEEICNELARLGYPPAAELRAWLRRGGF